MTAAAHLLKANSLDFALLLLGNFLLQSLGNAVYWLVAGFSVHVMVLDVRFQLFILLHEQVPWAHPHAASDYSVLHLHKQLAAKCKGTFPCKLIFPLKGTREFIMCTSFLEGFFNSLQ
jgi:hypothetical protein